MSLRTEMSFPIQPEKNIVSRLNHAVSELYGLKNVLHHYWTLEDGDLALIVELEGLKEARIIIDMNCMIKIYIDTGLKDSISDDDIEVDHTICSLFFNHSMPSCDYGDYLYQYVSDGSGDNDDDDVQEYFILFEDPLMDTYTETNNALDNSGNEITADYDWF